MEKFKEGVRVYVTFGFWRGCTGTTFRPYKDLISIELDDEGGYSLCVKSHLLEIDKDQEDLIQTYSKKIDKMAERYTNINTLEEYSEFSWVLGLVYDDLERKLGVDFIETES